MTQRRLGIILFLICAAMPAVFAETAAIHGTVTDAGGKPVRGAMISATKGNHLVARFSQPDGTYALKLEPGMYEVTVKAYGYASQALKTSLPQRGVTDFKLTERFDLRGMSSADVQQLLPDTQETRLIASECIRCHALTHVAKGGGMTKTTWAEFMPKMTHGRFWDNPYGTGAFTGSGSDVLDYKDRQDALSTALEKYFGPNSPYFGPDSERATINQINHPPVTDLALKLTIHEYDIPTKDVGAHSIMVDDAGNAWYSEIQAHGNKVGKFDWRTKKFTEYTLPIPESRPHTGVIGKDGLVWMPLTARRIKAKLASIDPKTGKIELYDFPGNPWRPHTTALDPDGNVWLSGTNDLVKFDVKTH